MSKTKSEDLTNPLIVIVLACLLLGDLATEHATTPPHVAQLYAATVSTAVLLLWIWLLFPWRAACRYSKRQTCLVIIFTIGLSFLLRVTEQTMFGVPSIVPQADIITKTWSAVLLTVIFRPLTIEWLLRAYFLQRVQLPTRDLVTITAAAAAFLGGDIHHAISNAVLSGLLTLAMKRGIPLWAAPLTHCTFAATALYLTGQ